MHYHKSNISLELPWKFDIMKAFDSVSWNVILDILEAFHLPKWYWDWITTCITTPKFSISISGALEGVFPGAEGPRLGNPLSRTFLIWWWSFSLGSCSKSFCLGASPTIQSTMPHINCVNSWGKSTDHIAIHGPNKSPYTLIKPETSFGVRFRSSTYSMKESHMHSFVSNVGWIQNTRKLWL